MLQERWLIFIGVDGFLGWRSIIRIIEIFEGLFISSIHLVYFSSSFPSISLTILFMRNLKFEFLFFNDAYYL